MIRTIAGEQGLPPLDTPVLARVGDDLLAMMRVRVSGDVAAWAVLAGRFACLLDPANYEVAPDYEPQEWIAIPKANTLQLEVVGYASPHQLERNTPAPLTRMGYYGRHRVALFAVVNAVELARSGKSPRWPGMEAEQKFGDVLRPTPLSTELGAAIGSEREALEAASAAHLVGKGE
jgi:hypothetical protein